MDRLKLSSLPALALLLTTSSFAQSSIGNDEATLRQIKTELWPRLYREQDVQGLERLLHPSFQMLDGSGQRSTRAQELDYVANNAPSYQSFRFEIVRLDIYANGTAVVDGVGYVNQDRCQTYTYASSNVLIKQQGEWRAIASHVSGGETTRLETQECES